MAITFDGIDPYPADAGSEVGPTNTPDKDTGDLAAAVAGDLIVVICHLRSTLSGRWPFASNMGGQQWQSTRVIQGTTIRLGVFFCRFNGTWASDPIFGHSDAAGTTTLSTHVMCFSPTSADKQWQVDVGPSTFSYTATGTTKTLTGHTTTRASTVTLAIWATLGTITWSTLAGSGWSQTGLSAQYGNLGGSDHVTALAYNIQTSAVALANVSLDQSVGTAGVGYMISFAEVDFPTGTNTGTAGYLTSSVNSHTGEGDNTVQCTVPTGTVAGDGVYVYAAYETSGTPGSGDFYPTSISDGTNTYQIVHRYAHQNYDHECVVAYCPEITGSPTTVTLTLSDTAGFWTMMLMRVEHMGTFNSGRGSDLYADIHATNVLYQTDAFTPSVDNCLVINGGHLPGNTEAGDFFTSGGGLTERLENHGVGSTWLATLAQTTAASVRGDVTMDNGRNCMQFCGAFTSVAAAGGGYNAVPLLDYYYRMIGATSHGA